MSGLRIVLLACVAGLAARADILTYTFQCITNNNPDSCAIGEAQLFVDVVGYPQTVQIGSYKYGPSSAGEVLFRFYNTGPSASVIRGVYFDNGSLSALESLIGMDGVEFSPKGSPPHLPGGDSLSSEFDATFWATADQPPSKNGIDPGEALGVLFTLGAGTTWDDVIGALGSGDLRIGIHVQAFPGEYSESFVNGGVVPEPAAILLVGSVLLILGRRLKAQKA